MHKALFYVLIYIHSFNLNKTIIIPLLWMRLLRLKVLNNLLKVIYLVRVELSFEPRIWFQSLCTSDTVYQLPISSS